MIGNFKYETDEILMKLWTWQKKGFSLNDPSQKINSKSYSMYYEQYKDKFEKIWKSLGTDQFIWCYINPDDAISDASAHEYKNHTLWELDAPETEIFHNICSIAWSRVLSNCRCCPPIELRSAWQRADLSKSVEIENEFHQFGDNKNEDELWEMLFVIDGIVTHCSTPLIKYPFGNKIKIKQLN
jgi:hypothetical protein